MAKARTSDRLTPLVVTVFLHVCKQLTKAMSYVAHFGTTTVPDWSEVHANQYCCYDNIPSLQSQLQQEYSDKRFICQWQWE